MFQIKLLCVVGLALGASGLQEFILPQALPDKITLKRNFILDTTSSDSFVLHSQPYAKIAGRSSTYNPGESTSSKHIGYGEGVYQNETRNAQAFGRLIEDRFSLYDFTRGRFYVATELKGGFNPALSLNGSWRAGRLGFGRGESLTTLSKKLVESGKHATVCAEAFRNSCGHYEQSAKVGVDLSSLNGTSKVRAIPDKSLWKIPVSSIVINGSRHSLTGKAVISTVTDKIILPARYEHLLVNVLGATKVGNRYEVDCEAANEVSIVSDGQTLSLDYAALYEEKKCACFLKIETGNNDDLVLGLPLFAGRGVCLDFQDNNVIFYKERKEQ